MSAPLIEDTDRACPDCKGTGGSEGRGRCVSPYEHEEECDCPRYWEKCWTCKGTGELVGLARATYYARGGPPPVPRRGYA